MYFILLIGYNRYLSSYHAHNRADAWSSAVAAGSVNLAKIAGFKAEAVTDSLQPRIWIYMDGQKTSYINEGCNAVSLLILFAAFIVAFSTTWIKTLLYILGGWVVIQLMNILRIVWLNYIFRYHQEYGKAAHDYLFPLLIYGTVFLLWVVWVRMFFVKKIKAT